LESKSLQENVPSNGNVSLSDEWNCQIVRVVLQIQIVAGTRRVDQNVHAFCARRNVSKVQLQRNAGLKIIKEVRLGKLASARVEQVAYSLSDPLSALHSAAGA
jgi:hypothetical protein